MTGRGTASRFLGSVLRNGLGRYVCQLQRLTLTLSRDAQSSRGAREYVEEKVVDFARQNPGIVVYVTPKKSRVPTVVAEYLNGTVKEETLTSKTADEIAQIIQKLANQSGLEIIRIRKPYHTDNPSIQGQWHPFTNKPSVLNVQNVVADGQGNVRETYGYVLITRCTMMLPSRHWPLKGQGGGVQEEDAKD